ncbi:hypothetical protein PQX77_002011 [Marasmius sp. AFHP31]|nr:hypothetical protein PQX77_002011 [Marasmius sp. AFHP31]
MSDTIQQTRLSEQLLCSACQSRFSPLPITSPVSPGLLRAGVAPSKLEKLRNEDALASEVHELHLYDQELERLELDLQNLREQRNLIAARIEERKSWMAPIRTLPPEILGEIFSAVCFSDEFSLSIGKSRDLRAPRVDKPALDLSHVSHHWRQVAFGHSRLWSSIEVDLWEPVETFDNLIGTYLENSAGVSLQIGLRDSSYRNSGNLDRGSYRQRHLKKGSYVFDWLLSHSPRIAALHLDGVHLAHALPQDPSRFTFPLLRRFECNTDLTQVDPTFMEKIERAPLLSSVVLLRPYLPLASHEGLTNLRLTNTVFGLDEFEVLAASSLQSLTIENYCAVHTRPISFRHRQERPGPVSLPFLQHLAITASGYPSFNLPTSLELPALEDLEITYRKGVAERVDETSTMDDWPCNAFISLLRSCSDTLTRLSLTFKNHTPPASAAREILRSVPNLRQLEVHLRRDVDGFTRSLLDALTVPGENERYRQQSSREVLTPRLTSLEMTIVKGASLLDSELGWSLAEMLASRSTVKGVWANAIRTARFDIQEMTGDGSAMFWERIRERGLLDSRASGTDLRITTGQAERHAPILTMPPQPPTDWLTHIHEGRRMRVYEACRPVVEGMNTMQEEHMRTLHTLPPNPFNASNPSQSCWVALHAARGLCVMDNPDFIALSRAFWPQIYLWISFFIKEALIKEHSHPLPPKGIEFRRKAIFATHGVLCRVVELHMAKAEEIKRTQEMIPLITKLAFHLVKIQDPTFELIWSPLVKIIDNCQNINLFRRGLRFIAASADDEVDDVATITLRMLETESRRTPVVDVYVLYSLIEMVMMCSRYNPHIHKRFLSENVATRIPRVFSCYLPHSRLYRSGDPPYIFQGVSSACLVLKQAYDNGFSWACHALDEGLLATIVALFTSDLKDNGTRTNEAVHMPISMCLNSLRALLVFRSVLNRVYRYAKIVPNEQMRRLSRTAPSVQTPLMRLLEEAQMMKKKMNAFDHDPAGLVCSNLSCTRSRRRQRAGKRVKWKRCFACRTVVYCSEDCQTQDWDHRHSRVCRQNRPLGTSESYRISNLDEAFLRRLVSLEERKRGTRRQLQSIHTKSLDLLHPMIAQFDFRVSPMQLKEVPYEEVLKAVQPVTNERCQYGKIDCCAVDKRACCKKSKEDLEGEREAWDRSTEIICQVAYIGLECHSSVIFRKDK